MIKVETNFPLAIDSDDHLHPEGAYIDNNVNPGFIYGIEQYYQGRKIDFMDLGCAGGGLVCEMIDRGHNAIGLEGSDTCLNPRKEFTDTVSLPAGYSNWQKHGYKRLFTCDVTKPYQVYQDGKPLQFDLITCWDVMEHFYPEQIEPFMRLVYNHLKPGGIFVASIALFDSGRHPSLLAVEPDTHDINYHKSVYGPDWWLPQLDLLFNRISFPFREPNRPFIPLDQDTNYILYTGVKK